MATVDRIGLKKYSQSLPPNNFLTGILNDFGTEGDPVEETKAEEEAAAASLF